jgi:hypothetical protein
MRVPHYARRSLAALALTALVAGCGGDSNAPDNPFDPEGTSADIDAVEASYDSPATTGFSAATGAISAVLGESSAAAAAVKVAPTRDLLTARRKLSARKRSGEQYSATVAKAYVRPSGGMRPSFSTAAILDEHLGVTFVYNPETNGYEPSELTGAPEDGVRFIVYAVNPVSGAVIEPVVEVGYADIVTTEATNGATVRIELVSDAVTYLDYSVGVTGVTGSDTEITVTVSGFVSNGDDRVDFDLDNQLTFDDQFTLISATLDYNLTVPTRGGFRIDAEVEATTSGATSTIEARGPHGTVTITGSETTSGGTWEVEVNGDLFATINKAPGEQPVITGADGGALTPAESAALVAIFVVLYQGFDFFEDLYDPLV